MCSLPECSFWESWNWPKKNQGKPISISYILNNLLIVPISLLSATKQTKIHNSIRKGYLNYHSHWFVYQSECYYNIDKAWSSSLLELAVLLQCQNFKCVSMVWPSPTQLLTHSTTLGWERESQAGWTHGLRKRWFNEQGKSSTLEQSKARTSFLAPSRSSDLVNQTPSLWTSSPAHLAPALHPEHDLSYGVGCALLLLCLLCTPLSFSLVGWKAQNPTILLSSNQNTPVPQTLFSLQIQNAAQCQLLWREGILSQPKNPASIFFLWMDGPVKIFNQGSVVTVLQGWSCSSSKNRNSWLMCYSRVSQYTIHFSTSFPH